MNDQYLYERISEEKNREGDPRKPWEKDYARIIHSASFRRLQGKTQILNLGDSDFYRTRLTHSLEVSQVAMGIVRCLKECRDESWNSLLPDFLQIQAIGLAHDLGHPPFGHGGEVALNFCMRKYGGFEGNGQTLRILTKLEKYTEENGTNLTRRTLLGLLKYPNCYSVLKNKEPKLQKGTETIKILDRGECSPPKSYLDTEETEVDWILSVFQEEVHEFKSIKDGKDHTDHKKTKYKSLDCSIMDVADDIAYGVHDLEDAIALKLLTRSEFELYIKDSDKNFLDFSKNKGYLDSLFGDSKGRKRAIGDLVNYFIQNTKITTNPMTNPHLRYKAILPHEAKLFLDNLQKLVTENVIYSPSVQHLEFKGQKMVVSVFEVLCSEPQKFLPNDMYDMYKREETTAAKMRVICDYIAGMTDMHLLKTYDRLFSPRCGSIFDRI